MALPEDQNERAVIVSLLKILYGANAFEINDIQRTWNWASRVRRLQRNNVTLRGNCHRINSLGCAPETFQTRNQQGMERAAQSLDGRWGLSCTLESDTKQKAARIYPGLTEALRQLGVNPDRWYRALGGIMLKKIVRDLERRRSILEREVTAIGAALGALVGGLGKKNKRRRKLSKAARAKIAKAQKLRWQKVRLAKKQAK
jgi:hypothetical protein